MSISELVLWLCVPWKHGIFLRENSDCDVLFLKMYKCIETIMEILIVVILE